MKRFIAIICLVIIFSLSFSSCDKEQSAANNNKLNNTTQATTQLNTEGNDITSAVESVKKTWAYSKEEAKAVGYDCDISADASKIDTIDCKVLDSLYSTTINDWYANFNDYDGKSVEIEGYYITAEGQAYTWVGRNGPSCQYCSNGYVCFEFYTDSDLSYLKNDCSDWVTVKGILRKANDGTQDFYYIEAVSIEKTPEGQGTISN